jgi:hypothetical protein
MFSPPRFSLLAILNSIVSAAQPSLRVQPIGHSRSMSVVRGLMIYLRYFCGSCFSCDRYFGLSTSACCVSLRARRREQHRVLRRLSGHCGRSGHERREEAEDMGALRRSREVGRWQGWTSRGWMRRSRSSLGWAERLLMKRCECACSGFWPLAGYSLATWQFHRRRWEKHHGG